MVADNKQNEIKIVNNQPPKVVLETFAEDMANVISDTKEGSIREIIQGEEEHDAEKKSQTFESKENKIFVFVGILLLIVAFSVTAFLFLRKTANVVEVKEQFAPIIFSDKSVPLEISGLRKDEIMQAVSNEINNTTVKAGGLEGIYLTENKQIIGLRRFFTLIKSNFVLPESTLLVSDNFLMGVVKNQATAVAPASGTGFFILLKVHSTADVFNSLHAWEPNLFNDLYGFLGINISSDTNYLLTKNFTDGIIENKNARILYDNNNNIILMYIFADDNSVIITDSENAAHEIILRLASAQTISQ